MRKQSLTRKERKVGCGGEDEIKVETEKRGTSEKLRNSGGRRVEGREKWE